MDLMTAASTEADLREPSFANEMAAVLSALDCLLGDELGLYTSVEIGGGRPLYQMLVEAGLHTSGELRESLGDREFRHRLLEPQKALALELSHAIRLRHPEELLVSPVNFHFEGWTLQEYRTLWGTVLRTRIRALYFGDDWEYSENCAFDFKVAWEVGLPTFSSEGQPILLSEGRFRIQSAILELDAEGYNTAGLAASLQNLGRRNRVAATGEWPVVSAPSGS
ncbi:MAG TPA: hypothetical protein VN851_07480 [Thermoanaerobaculia bacterium]|nr:hypothetical protein [Thermoanaerobaculia bacterium]